MNSSQTKTIYFITGASSTGKSTLIDGLMKKYKNKPWSFIHFDSIGVPPVREMEREFGSPSAWQRTKTFEWIDRLVHVNNAEKIFFEGQVNPEFIREGFENHRFENYHIVLLDCSEEEMSNRLTNKRRQPELFTEDMKNWLRYLRRLAIESGTPILDSSDLSPEEVVRAFEKTIGF